VRSWHHLVVECDSSSKSVRDRVTPDASPKKEVEVSFVAHKMSRGGRGGFHRGGGEHLRSLDRLSL